MVNEPQQPRQTSEGDKLAKKRVVVKSQQEKELVEALFKLSLCNIVW